MADLIPFRKHPVRAWFVSRSGDDFCGELRGAGIEPTRTETGNIGLVLEALINPCNRRGMPVIAPDYASNAVSGCWPLRPTPKTIWRRTDAQKYAEAVERQRIFRGLKGGGA